MCVQTYVLQMLAFNELCVKEINTAEHITRPEILFAESCNYNTISIEGKAKIRVTKTTREMSRPPWYLREWEFSLNTTKCMNILLLLLLLL
jgi:hypothetical protein